MKDQAWIVIGNELKKSGKFVSKKNNFMSNTPINSGPVLGRFDRFYHIGPRTLKGPRASRGPLLYYEAQNKGKCYKLNQCLIWCIFNVSKIR